MADAGDLKSPGPRAVWVRIPPPPPSNQAPGRCGRFAGAVDLEHTPVEGKPGLSILTLHGEFVTDELPAVSQRVDAIIESGQYRFIINLNGLAFIESSPLGFLIKTQERLKKSNGEVVLSQPSAFLRTAINTLGLDYTFRVFPTDEQALEHFGGAAL